MRDDGTQSLCDIETCGELCVVVVKIHRRSEPLLGSIGEGLCRTHAHVELLRLIEELSPDGDVMGISCVLY